ncbi:MAG: M17 family peptidase N-terminal domain-containing protein [Nitrospiria bacterium]
MQIKVFSGKLSELRSEALVVSCFEDVRPLGGLAAEIDWLYGGIISRLIMQDKMTGGLGETLLLAPQDKLQVSKVVLIGLGAYAAYSYPQIKSIAKQLVVVMDGLNVRDRAVELLVPDSQEIDLTLSVESFLSGWQSGVVGKKKQGSFDLTFVVEEGEGAKRLQQKILNDGNLWKGNYFFGSGADTGSASYSFSQ